MTEREPPPIRDLKYIPYIPTFFPPYSKEAREAVFVDWRDMKLWLGRPYQESDKTELINFMMTDPGAVSFVADGEAISTDYGLYFLGQIATALSWN